VWNLRARRDSHFVGRDTELAALRTLLRARRVAIVNEGQTPLGGMGASSLAREYAYRNAPHYQVVWWMQAEEAGPLHLAFSQLMSALNLVRRIPDDPPHDPGEVREFLSAHGGWLLIFDGLEDLVTLSKYLPERPAGHVIVTTLLGAGDSPYETLPLSPFSPETAEAYLRAVLPAGPPEVLAALARKSGGSPLNVRLLGDWAQVMPAGPAGVVKNLNARLPEPLRDGVTAEVAKAITRFVVGELAVLLEAEDRPSRDLFSLCAYLAPHDIPEFLFTPREREEEILSQRLSAALESRGGLDGILTRLARYGLIERHADSFSMHELVQEVSRERLSPEAAKAWANAATRLVADSFPYQPLYAEPDPACSRLLTHALACTQYAEEAKVAREASAKLLYYAGLYLHGNRALNEAKTCYQLAVSQGQRVYGGDHPLMATRINSLGIIEHELGNLQQARDCFETAFAICEKIYGPVEQAVYGAPDEKLLTIPIRNLCAILEEMGDAEAAQQTYEKAMKIYLEVYGWNHPLVAECADRFGRTWHKLGRLAKARNCFEKAVLAEESAEDPHLGTLATYLNNLAMVLIEMREPQLAHERLSRALRLDNKTFGDRHPSVARDLANLGHACRELRQLDDAERYYREALAMVERTEGEDSAHAAALLNHLGIILLDNAKPAPARSCIERALTLNRQRYGEESDEVVRNLTNLGRALDEMGAHSQALSSYEQAIGILERQGGQQNERKATILYRIGRSLNKQKRYEEALPRLQQAMRIDTQLFGKQHPAVARDAFAIGCVLADTKDTVVAMGHFTLALDIYEQTVGKNDPRARKVRQRLEELSSR
jgi:tetratricopeptide (TPR) repeat protein